jgi:nucleotide-binding universal stress UspA family protein
MAERPSPIRRILVALDASPASRFAIETAVGLASRSRAEVVGLFVEDINLLRVARLPFVREIATFSHAARPLEPGEMERQLRGQAERMRRALSLAADLRDVPWQFRVRRGPVAVELMAAGADADLMIMGRAGRRIAPVHRMGSTVRAMVLQRSGMTFVLTSEYPSSAPAIALFDGSAAGCRALSIAGFLVESQVRTLTVILVADRRAEVQTLRETALRELETFTLSGDFRVMVRPTHSSLGWLVRATGNGPVILPCGRDRLEGEPLCRLVDDIPNPVLVVR